MWATLIRLIPALGIVITLAGPTQAADEEKKEAWVPPAPEGLPEKWDWIQLTSLEWLKGELIALYDESLEFESDELDTLMLDWEDIKRVRTARRMEVRLRGPVDIRGRLYVEDRIVRIIPRDGPEQEFLRADLISATIGSPKEIDHWSMNITIGANVRTGNSNVAEANATSRFVRRSARNRVSIDYTGNYNLTESELVSNNHRASTGWDKFVSDRFFWNPIYFEIFRDPFQNIRYRSTYSVGVGYHVIDGKKTEWDISGGPGFQRTVFEDVTAGEADSEYTPALSVSSTTDMELTRWLDFLTEYRFQFNNEASGRYNHHMVIAFETDITSLLDFDVQWIWDRIQDPRENSDGIVPEQDDFRLVVGIGFDF